MNTVKVTKLVESRNDRDEVYHVYRLTLTARIDHTCPEAAGFDLKIETGADKISREDKKFYLQFNGQNMSIHGLKEFAQFLSGMVALDVQANVLNMVLEAYAK